MSFEPGASVWVPCEVFRSVFPDERNVRIESPEGPWSGFVDSRFLRDDISEGHTAIRATIVTVNGAEVSARLPGQTQHTRYLTGSATWFRRIGNA